MKLDPARAPRLVAWEATRACDLACVHCRAVAQPRPDPRQLSTDEAFRLVDDVAAFQEPVILIITGGDPLKREDILAVAARASQAGLRVVMSPSGTNVTPRIITGLKEAGVQRISVSLDGSTPVIHDAFRQIPGAFERLTHRVAGRTLTLDQIEQTILPGFHDPRVYFALGRGAHGGGRLRSEAFTPVRLETQLTEAAGECVTRTECLQIDPNARKVAISAVFSWREKEFSAAYAGGAPAAFASRSPIERAAIAFVGPKLLAAEKTFLAANAFQVVFKPFDWTLNDLTGRGGR